MKNIIYSCLLVIGIWAGLFWYRNLRGIRPIIQPVVKIAENETGLPLTVPEGFTLSIFAQELGNPRVLAFDENGTLHVSIPSQGKVVTLPEKTTVIEGLNRPHGIAFKDGKLFVAETDKVTVDKKKIVDLPAGGNHYSRTIQFGPDGNLYISVGSSCNVCVERDWRRASILVFDGELKPYATGLRNSVFFTWKDGVMWATDMGRDLLGDNTPKEEVNIIVKGGDYGWPYCYEDQVHDDQFDPRQTNKCEHTMSPVLSFQAHSAPLGLAFIPQSWPQQYRGDLLVAYHGSWNRTDPTGYKVVRFDLDAGNLETDFLTGFYTGKEVIGRPVDLVFDEKGNLFVSDDKGGNIFKISPL